QYFCRNFYTPVHLMELDPEKFTGEGLTFDDVLMVPAYSEVMPREVNIKSRFSKNIEIRVPVVSAAMDTVTEAAMAIAIAQEGGIGVLHKNMSIEAQAQLVRKVKRAESGMIIDPVTLQLDAKVGDALNMMAEYKIGGIPVVDKDYTLVGIATNRDLRFERNMTRPITEVMTKDNLITTTNTKDIALTEDTLQKYKIEKLPVVDANYKLIGLITYKDLIKTKLRPNACKDEFGRLRVAAAIGITGDMLDRVRAVVATGVDAIVLDTAHGHSVGVCNSLEAIKAEFPDLQVVVGNIATAEAAKMLVEKGADAVKVGIGPGSICTTRVIAGVGVPQLTAIMNVAKALQGTGVPVIADGGIKFTGDVVKAIAAGADTVMMGSMFAGVEESPGRTVILEGRKFKTYRGMGSIEAMQQGSKDRYFQDAEEDVKKLVPEGIVGRVPYKGTLSEVMYQLIGGLRSGMGYCGTTTITELQKAKFIRISAAGIRESHPHGITITSEAPNYSP
ncbi:MAG: IMP dehydrogenase, partial [Bacteroidia bacterium]